MPVTRVSPPNGAVLITVTDSASPQLVRAGGAAVDGEVVGFCANAGATWCWVQVNVAGKLAFRVNVPFQQTIPGWIGPILQNEAVEAFAETGSRISLVLQARTDS